MRNCLGLSIISCLTLLTVSCASISNRSFKPNFIGHIYEQKFNNMPMIDKPDSKGAALETVLYIFEPTSIRQIEAGLQQGQFVSKINAKLLDSVHSDKLGAYSLYLKPGKYSVFVKYENGYYVPFYSGKEGVSIIETKQNEITELDITVKANSSFE